MCDFKFYLQWVPGPDDQDISFECRVSILEGNAAFRKESMHKFLLFLQAGNNEGNLMAVERRKDGLNRDLRTACKKNKPKGGNNVSDKRIEF